MKLGIARIALVALALCAPCAAARASDFDATISTIAGTGAAGAPGGDVASLVQPMAAVRDADGTVYIADGGGARIWASSGGTLRVVAGSGNLDEHGLFVDGGFQDGPVAGARFSFPSGIAATAGRVYVADTGNHCIRAIAGGMVSTFAGACMQRGSLDGAANTARFDRPLQLAVTADKSLLVADYGNGLRKISPTGEVSTLVASSTITGVAVSPGPLHTIFVADAGGLILLKGGVRFDIPATDSWKLGLSRAAMDGEIGEAWMLAAVDDSRLLYTDRRTGAVTYYATYDGTLRAVVGSGREDARNDDAGFADGPLSSARVADPSGISVDGSGAFLVADSANRRVRRIQGMNFRMAAIPSQSVLSVSQAPPGRYRVAVIGNSFVWDDTIWDDSFEKRVERKLDSGGRGIYVDPIRLQDTSLDALFAYLREIVAETRRDDFVVILLNHAMFQSDPSWEATLAAQLPLAAKELREAGIPLVVAYHPMAQDLLWPEYPELEINAEGRAFVPGGGIAYARTIADLRRTSVPVIDLWPAFLAAEARPDHRPLFGTDDQHFTDSGRAVTGDALGALLEPFLAATKR